MSARHERKAGCAANCCVAVGLALASFAGAAGQAVKPAKPTVGECSRVVFEGSVTAGQSFEKLFAGTARHGLEFYLEPLPSGWIVRVLAAGEARGPHDYAELASPPYLSVSPLLISTDFAFRSQDAVAWNPRRFRYAENAAVFEQMERLYPRVMANDGAAMGALAELAENQPEMELDLLDTKIVPGTADQWQMAAAVASHLEQTPHEVVQGEKSTALGRLAAMTFRVSVELAKGVQAAPGAVEEKIPCVARPTTR